MIGSLRGVVLDRMAGSGPGAEVLLEVGGVGYRMAVTPGTLAQLGPLGSPAFLHIHTHVREDVIAMYGFQRPSEKLLFEKLISVSGIGPKLAITILSGMAADEMVAAIRGNDVARLTRIPGIGKKTAERMVLELRDKLPETAAIAATPVPALNAVEEDVLSALTNLGYQRPVAEKALAAAAKNGKSGSFDGLFREALAALSR